MIVLITALTEVCMPLRFLPIVDDHGRSRSVRADLISRLEPTPTGGPGSPYSYEVQVVRGGGFATIGRIGHDHTRQNENDPDPMGDALRRWQALGELGKGTGFQVANDEWVVTRHVTPGGPGRLDALIRLDHVTYAEFNSDARTYIVVFMGAEGEVEAGYIVDYDDAILKRLGLAD